MPQGNLALVVVGNGLCFAGASIPFQVKNVLPVLVSHFNYFAGASFPFQVRPDWRFKTPLSCRCACNRVCSHFNPSCVCPPFC